MDALTNVVGLLVLLLVFLQLGVGDAVKSIREKNPELFGLSEQDVEKAKEADQAQEALRQKLESERVAAELAVKKVQDTLEAEKAKLPPPPAAATKMKEEEVQKLVDEQKKKAETLQKEFSQMDEQLAKLLAMLAKTPDPQAASNTAITLPDPHAVPAGHDPIYFFCKNNRIICLELPKIREAAAGRIEANRSSFEWKNPADKGKLSSTRGLQGTRKANVKSTDTAKALVYDGKKIQDTFAANPMVSQDFKVSFKSYDTSTSLNMLLEPLDNKGETKADLMGSHSKYVGILSGIRARKQKVYAQFMVSADSFEIYLEARALIAKYEIPAGWQILYNPKWEVSLSQPIRVHQRVVPPPPPTTTPATPAKPAPPPKLLD
jgi:hypothetical protein